MSNIDENSKNRDQFWDKPPPPSILMTNFSSQGKQATTEQQSRAYKNCEQFCIKLHRQYPLLYQQLLNNKYYVLLRKLVNLTNNFNIVERQSTVPYHRELECLFSENSDILGDLNKLLHADARIVRSVGHLELSSNDKATLLEVMQEIHERGLSSQEQMQLVRERFRDDQRMVSIIYGLIGTPLLNVLIKELDQNKKDKKFKSRVGYDKPRDLMKKLKLCKNLNSLFYQAKDQENSNQHNQSDQASDLINNYYFLVNGQSHTRDIKNEIMVFERIRIRAQRALSEPNKFFEEFMKVLHLFTESVVTHQELMEMFGGLSWVDRELALEFRQVTYTRNESRRKNAVLFKPLKDTEFKNAERVTHSYVKMHPGYANTTSQVDMALNSTWVSVPFGSEDYSFQIMRKNTFEEQLFKIEDEKYEYDFNILQYRKTSRLLEQLQTQIPNNIQELIVQKILSLKVLQQIYKSSASEQMQVIRLLQSNPIDCAGIYRERLEQKYKEIVDSRNNVAASCWQTTQLNNFHRSLDHRSFYFKKNEKLYTTPLRFLKEPEDRLKLMVSEMQAKKQDTPKFAYLQGYLNSFETLTTFEPLSAGHSIPFMPTLTPSNMLQVPIFNFLFTKKELLIETTQLLVHYIVLTMTPSERQWAVGFVVQFVNMVFQLPVPALDYKQLITNETSLKADVLSIEQSIFDANFSYLQQYSHNTVEEATNGCYGPLSSKKNLDVVPQSPPIEPSEQSESQFSRILSCSPSQCEQEVYSTSIIEMEEISMNMIPNRANDPNMRVLYGSSGIYLFIRYLYSIYQRLEIAQHISFHFDQNKKTEKLTQSQKYSIGKKRYILFKSALLQSLKAKEFKYEDYLRSIFAKQAFLFGTIEKLFLDCCKNLASLQSDGSSDTQMKYTYSPTSSTSAQQLQTLIEDFLKKESSTDSIPTPLYRFNPNITEEMQLVILTNSIISIPDRSNSIIMRFTFTPAYETLSINFIPSGPWLPDHNTLQKMQLNMAEYISSIKKVNRVFLKRNLRQSSFSTTNKIQMIMTENAKLRSLGQQMEDIIISKCRNIVNKIQS